MTAELITDSLSPSIIVGPSTGTPRCRSARRKSMTCSVHVLAATCSKPNVAVSTVDCNLEHQSIGVLLSWWRTPATDLPLTRSWHRLASKCDVTVAGFPFGLGASKGVSSFASAQQVCSQSCILTGTLEQSGVSVLILFVTWRIFERHPWILLTRSRCPHLGTVRKRERDTTAVWMPRRSI